MSQAVKNAGEVVKHVTGHESVNLLNGAQPLTQGINGVFTAFGPHAGVVIGLGMMSAINASLAYAEYNSERREILDTYRDELSAKLGKDRRKLRYKDIDRVAEGSMEQGVESNHTLNQALQKARSYRNLNVGLSIFASLGSFALISIAFPPAAPGAAIIAHGAAEVITQAAIGLITYLSIKAPLKWIGEKVLGLDRETTHDRIVSLERDRARGRFITREQVLSVFVSANEELDTMIRKTHGKQFDKLKLAEQQQIAAEFGKLIGLDQLTDAINHRQMKASELAFTVEGQVSGFVRAEDEPQAKGWFGALKEKLFGASPPPREYAAPQTPFSMPQYADDPPSRSFVERLARKPAEAGVSHVERLEQSRAGEPSLLQQR